MEAFLSFKLKVELLTLMLKEFLYVIAQVIS